MRLAVNKFKIPFGGRETLVADELLDKDDRVAIGKLVSDEGVAQVVDFGVVNAGNPEVAFNGAADVAD